MDGTGAALSGRTYLTGWPDRDPVIPGAVPYGDVIVPYAMAAGVSRCAAASARVRRGAHIDASMYEICVQQMHEAILQTQTGTPRTARAITIRACSTRGCTRCKAMIDGSRSRCRRAMIGSACGNSRPCRRRATSRPRRGDRGLEPRISRTPSLRTGCKRPGIAAGVVQDIEDLMERDPQIAARGSLMPTRPSAARHVRAYAYADDLLAQPCSRPIRAPSIGEHSAAIAAKLCGLQPRASRNSRSLGVFR